jgi:Tfp pilus assembly protein PilP
VPGALTPELKQAEEGDEKTAREPFVLLRDPFKQPTEILPSECPPSMPLCRFDRSQLKLVGVMQVSEGQFKGLVEDPDGRGYFITAGMQIGGATVTQVTNKGIILHVHRTRQDVTMPLFREAREIGD